MSMNDRVSGNSSKCESICISFQRSPLLPNYTLNGDGIPSKSVVHYLGVHINTHLKWNDHVKYVTAKASRCLNFLRYFLFACSSAVTVVWEKFKVGNIREKKVRGKNIFVSAGCRRKIFNAKHFYTVNI